jgi:hypothetical protein
MAPAERAAAGVEIAAVQGDLKDIQDLLRSPDWQSDYRTQWHQLSAVALSDTIVEIHYMFRMHRDN